MKIIDYIEGPIPIWALAYLVNGDSSGISEEDEKQADNWWNESAKALPEDSCLVLDYDEEEGSFDPSPLFGLACDCIDGGIWAMVKHDDPRPEIELPGWVKRKESAGG
jgi:hypothetical protein|tara:strand:- start:2456 stop:2779 length:324 start_codon:yes stop_codon:yes gene_type:complete